MYVKAFAVANKLYGITLNKLEGIPTYHPDVEVFEVKDADGSQLGIFYVDYFPRSGKKRWRMDEQLPRTAGVATPWYATYAVSPNRSATPFSADYGRSRNSVPRIRARSAWLTDKVRIQRDFRHQCRTRFC